MPDILRTSIGARFGLRTGSATVSIRTGIVPTTLLQSALLGGGGVGALSLVSKSIKGAALSGTGTSAATLLNVGLTIVSGALSGTGAASYAGTGSASQGSALTASGVGTLSIVGRMLRSSVLAASGVGALAAAGAMKKAGALSASGTGSAALVSSSAPVLQLIASSYSDGRVDPVDATATFTLANTGAATGGVVVDSGNGNYSWLTGGNAGDYEVVVTLTAGTFSSGLEGVFNLGTTRAWTAQQTEVGDKTTTATYLIRYAGGGATVVSATSITLFATVV